MDSDEALESDEQSGSDDASELDDESNLAMLDSDGDGSEVSESNVDREADLMLEDSEDEAAAVSQDSLEERRAGMPAETSGQPAVTPGRSSATLLYNTIFGAVHCLMFAHHKLHRISVFGGLESIYRCRPRSGLLWVLPVAAQMHQAPLFAVILQILSTYLETCAVLHGACFASCSSLE